MPRMPVNSYSFTDTIATISGPGGTIDLSAGNGVAEEGVTIEYIDAPSTMMIGADGEGVHSLSANRSCRVTVRLLKNSPSNKLLMNLHNFQRASGTLWGQNIISIENKATGDKHVAQQVAFGTLPTPTYAKNAEVMNWTFEGIRGDSLLGSWGG